MQFPVNQVYTLQILQIGSVHYIYIKVIPIIPHFSPMVAGINLSRYTQYDTA